MLSHSWPRSTLRPHVQLPIMRLGTVTRGLNAGHSARVQVMRPLLALLLLQRAEALHQVRWAGTGLRRQGIPLQTLGQSRSRPLRC